MASVGRVHVPAHLAVVRRGRSAGVRKTGVEGTADLRLSEAGNATPKTAFRSLELAVPTPSGPSPPAPSVRFVPRAVDRLQTPFLMRGASATGDCKVFRQPPAGILHRRTPAGPCHKRSPSPPQRNSLGAGPCTNAQRALPLVSRNLRDEGKSRQLGGLLVRRCRLLLAPTRCCRPAKPSR